MRWPQDLAGWPLAQYSRMILHRPHRWHVQEAGSGPTLILLHGAGGASQSFRNLFPLLAAHFHVVSLDLPGQGFSQSGARHRLGLAPMAEDISALVRDQGWRPTAIVGHSAGAAIALQMTAEADDPALKVVGINAALSNFKGVAGWLFPMLAKVLASTPFTADIFSASVTAARVRRLVESTGSRLPAEGLELYRRLASDRDHVDGTLAMMAQWSLDDLLQRMPQIRSRVLFLVGENDLSVPPATSMMRARQMPSADVIALPKLGHLMHEEDAPTIEHHVRGFLDQGQAAK